MCAILLCPIPEGVIGIKPRGDTREKESPIRSLGWALRTPIRRGKGQFFSALKSVHKARVEMILVRKLIQEFLLIIRKG